jgi:hypothetical protein
MKHLPKRWLLADRQIQNVIKAGALALVFTCIACGLSAQIIESYAVEVRDTFGRTFFYDGLLDEYNNCHAIAGFMNVLSLGGRYYPSGQNPYKKMAIATFERPDSGIKVVQFGGYYGSYTLEGDLKRDSKGNLYCNLYEDSMVVLGTDTLRELPLPINQPLSWSHFGYIVSFNSIGLYRWHYQLEGIRTRARHISIDNREAIYISGIFDSLIILGSDTIRIPQTLPYQPILIKLDTNGKLIWSKWLKSTFRNAEITAMDSDSLGNLYLAVHIEDKEIEINGQTYYAKNGHLLVVALDTMGNTRWVRQIQGGLTTATELILGKSGMIVLSGTFNDYLKYATKEIVETPDNQVFMCLFNQDGMFESLTKIGGVGSVGLSVTSQAIYISGRILDFPAIFEDTTINCPSRLGNIYLAKYSYASQLQWVYAIIGDYSGSPEWLSVNENKEIALGISYRYEFVFKGDTFRQPDGLWQSGIILRLQDTSGIKPLSVSEEKVKLNEVIIYPNPAQTKLTLYSNFRVGSKFQYALYNLQGVQLIAGEVKDAQGVLRKEIDISELAQGVYVFTLKEGNETFTKKVVVSR